MKIKGIDEIDNRIINLLTKDARISYTEIAEKIGVTRTTVKNRIETLEECKLISGYKAIINMEKAPEMMPFLLNIETNAEKFETVKECLKGKKETATIFQVTGKYNIFAICLCSNIEGMRLFVNTISKEVTGIISLKYNTVLLPPFLVILNSFS